MGSSLDTHTSEHRVLLVLDLIKSLLVLKHQQTAGFKFSLTRTAIHGIVFYIICIQTCAFFELSWVHVIVIYSCAEKCNVALLWFLLNAKKCQNFLSIFKNENNVNVT